MLNGKVLITGEWAVKPQTVTTKIKIHKKRIMI